MSTSTQGRLMNGILTSIGTALILFSLNSFREDLNSKFRKIDERSQRIEDKYITKSDFNAILEAKLKQFKVTKEGRLIVAP